MRIVPIFPLPETVFFPGTVLPLHLFEPRYRQMGEDAIDGDGLLVVVLLAPGWERDYEGTPPVHDIATLGRIEKSDTLPDGRINIVLRGLERVRLGPTEGSELPSGKLYRVRRIESAPEEPEPPKIQTMNSLTEPLLREQWLELLEKSGRSEESVLAIPEPASFELVVNHMAAFVDIPPRKKQALLEQDKLSSRGISLLLNLGERLEFWRTLSSFREMRPDDPSVN